MAKRTFELFYPKKVDDGREVTPKMIKEIVANSNDKSRYPVAIGHARALGFFEDHHEAAGKLTNLRHDDDFTLLGDVDLQPDAEKAYKAGKYPGWSIGIFKTEANGTELDHLALLGSVGAAFKDLQEIDAEAFSQRATVLNQSPLSMEIQTFDANSKTKTLWLLQSTPKGPEIPAAPASQNKGDPKMTDELKAKIAERDKEIEQFRAENARLKADAEKRAEAEQKRRAEQFATIKTDLIKAAADKGVTEPARNELSKALDGYDVHYASGIVSPELFAAITKVLNELKPKVEPGQKTTDADDDDFIEKKTFSAAEAVDAILV